MQSRMTGIEADPRRVQLKNLKFRGDRLAKRKKLKFLGWRGPAKATEMIKNMPSEEMPLL
jgi:hypothetical protein